MLSPTTAVGGCSMSLALKCCLLAHFDCRSLARVGRVNLMLLPIRSSCNCLGCDQYLYAGRSAMIRVFTGAFPASCLNFSINHMRRLWQRIGTSWGLNFSNLAHSHALLVYLSVLNFSFWSTVLTVELQQDDTYLIARDNRCLVHMQVHQC